MAKYEGAECAPSASDEHQLHLLLADTKFQRAVQAYQSEDSDHDVAYLAGSSDDGEAVYFDREFADAIDNGEVKLNGKPIDPRPYIRVHEAIEGAILHEQYTKGAWVLGDADREDAAHRLGLLGERYAVEFDLGDVWPAYLKATEPWIKEDTPREVPEPPADIVREGDEQANAIRGAVNSERTEQVGARGGETSMAIAAVRDDDEAEGVADDELLERVLGETFGFYFKAHSFHWNVRGPLFSQLHAFFGEIYADAHGAVDALAEHIRTLDQDAPCSLEEMMEGVSIRFDDDVPPWQDMVRQLEAGNATVIAALKAANGWAVSSKHDGLANFLQERLDVHAKWHWMLRAYLA